MNSVNIRSRPTAPEQAFKVSVVEDLATLAAAVNNLAAALEPKPKAAKPEKPEGKK